MTVAGADEPVTVQPSVVGVDPKLSSAIRVLVLVLIVPAWFEELVVFHQLPSFMESPARSAIL